MTSPSLADRLAHNVRRLRKERGWTLDVAADWSGIHARHWQKIEAAEANVTLSTIEKLADAFTVDPSELIALSEK